jgi:hypothetical protein
MFYQGRIQPPNGRVDGGTGDAVTLRGPMPWTYSRLCISIPTYARYMTDLPAYVEDIRGRVDDEPARILVLVHMAHGVPVVQHVGIVSDAASGVPPRRATTIGGTATRAGQRCGRTSSGRLSCHWGGTEGRPTFGNGPPEAHEGCAVAPNPNPTGRVPQGEHTRSRIVGKMQGKSTCIVKR